MKNLKKISVIIFILLNIMIWDNSQVFACSCIMPESPSISMEKATSVFIWKVINIEDSIWINELLWSVKSKKVIFNVSTVIKWDKNKQVEIKTAESSASCWYTFEENEEYIVYTYWEKNNLEVSLCSRTSLTKNAEEDLIAFENIIEDNKSSWENLSNNDDSILKEKNRKNAIDTTYLLIAIISLIIIIYMKIKSSKEDSKN